MKALEYTESNHPEQNNSEDHLRGFSDDEKRLLKLMSQILVDTVKQEYENGIRVHTDI